MLPLLLSLLSVYLGSNSHMLLYNSSSLSISTPASSRLVWTSAVPVATFSVGLMASYSGVAKNPFVPSLPLFTVPLLLEPKRLEDKRLSSNFVVAETSVPKYLENGKFGSLGVGAAGTTVSLLGDTPWSSIGTSKWKFRSIGSDMARITSIGVDVGGGKTEGLISSPAGVVAEALLLRRRVLVRTLESVGASLDCDDDDDDDDVLVAVPLPLALEDILVRQTDFDTGGVPVLVIWLSLDERLSVGSVEDPRDRSAVSSKLRNAKQFSSSTSLGT